MRHPAASSDSMKLDPSMLDQLTACCKTPQDVAALYSQLLQRVMAVTQLN
jgi:hypothetical protein